MTKFFWGMLLGAVVALGLWLLFFERGFCQGQVKGKLGGFLSSLGLGSGTINTIDDVLFN